MNFEQQHHEELHSAAALLGNQSKNIPKMSFETHELSAANRVRKKDFSPVPDRIFYKIIKEFAQSSLDVLLKFYNVI